MQGSLLHLDRPGNGMSGLLTFHALSHIKKSIKAEASTPAHLLEVGQRERIIFASSFSESNVNLG